MLLAHNGSHINSHSGDDERFNLRLSFTARHDMGAFVERKLVHTVLARLLFG